MTSRRRTAIFLVLFPFVAAGCAGGLEASRPAAGVAALPEASAGTAAPSTVTGILIDTHCYSLDRAYATDDHRTPNGTIEGCAEACAKLGIPVGVLTASGDVVVLLVPAPDLADHMGSDARAVGRRTFANSLRPDSVFVKDDGGAWISVPLHQMM
jgi:hypothetical protein